MGVALIGIDFGTAATRAVRWRPSDEWTREVVEIPSLAVAQPDGLRVGDQALALASSHPEAVICGVKRLLERTTGDPVAQAVVSRCGAVLQAAEARLEVVTSNGVRLPVDGAVAAMLHQAASRVSQGDEVIRRYAVITTPEWYDPLQQAGLRAAAERAGVEVLRLIGEGAAMGLWMARQNPGDRTVALVNAGAGGISVTIASIDPQGVYISSTASDPLRGGDDVTAALVDGVMAELPDAAPGAREIVRQAVDSMRARLVADATVHATVTLAAGASGQQKTLTLERSDLLPMLNSLQRALKDACQEALEEAELEPDEVDAVYVTGGMSVFPSVVQCVADGFQQEVQRGRTLDHHVVLGAAYEAAVLTQQTEGPLVLDGQSTGRLSLPPVSR